MFPRAGFLCALLLAALPLRADESLQRARQAQALLGPAVWSQVIRVETRAPGSPYGPASHALVFEFSDVLWFYSSRDGTQSLSLRIGTVAEDKENLGALLREIDSGIRRWTAVAADPAPPAARGTLPRGCFIASLVALRTRLAAGRETRAPRLLTYYCQSSAGRKGHSVLVFGVGDQFEVFDPDEPGRVQVHAGPVPADAAALAREVGGWQVVKARWLELAPPREWGAVIADAAVESDAGRGARVSAQVAAGRDGASA